MPYRRIISALLVPVMLARVTACTKWTWVGSAQLRREEGKVKAVEYVPQVTGQTESPAREGVRHIGITAYFDDEPSAEQMDLVQEQREVAPLSMDAA